MQDKNKNNNSARFMPSADKPTADTEVEQEPNLLSDEAEGPSVLVEPEQIETADGGGGAKLPKQSSGAGKWVVIVLLVLALGGLGYWYYYKTQQLNTEMVAKAAIVSELQAKNDKLEAAAKKAVEANAENKADAEYIVIKEWGVKFKPGKDLADVVYYTVGNTAYLSTSSLMSSAQAVLKNDGSDKEGLNMACNPVADPIGMITRGKKGEKLLSGTYDSYPDAVKVGDYYYVYQGPQTACSADKKTTDLATKQNQALKVSAKTITASK